MNDVLATAMAQLQQSSMLELSAVVLAVVYLVLAVRQNIACWYAAFVSTTIFLYIFWQVNLYMESALQVFYLAMAVYGWYQWQHGAGEERQLQKGFSPINFGSAAGVWAIIFQNAVTDPVGCFRRPSL